MIAPTAAPTAMPAAKADPGIDAVAHLQDGGDVGAGAEEGGVAEGILPAIAAQDVPALPGQRDQQRHDEKIQRHVRLNKQRHDGERRDHQGDRQKHPSCPRSEQAARAHQQHRDEDEEDADLAERLAEKEAGQALHHADEQAADQRAGHRSHAAEHDDGEGDQHEGVARRAG